MRVIDDFGGGGDGSIHDFSNEGIFFDGGIHERYGEIVQKSYDSQDP
jgi:hypothetical protein